MNAVTEGIDALAVTRVLVSPKMDEHSATSTTAQGRVVQRSFSGTGSHSDIVVSSTRAYANALNKLISVIAANREREAAEATEDEEAQEPVGAA